MSNSIPKFLFSAFHCMAVSFKLGYSKAMLVRWKVKWKEKEEKMGFY